MLGIALKAAAPLVVAAALLLHSTTGGLAAGAVGLTDVAGRAGDCAAPVTNGACAALFDGHDVLYPGRTLAPATVSIAYHGATPASMLGLYVSRYSARTPASAASCTAPDPAAKLDLTIAQGAAVIYRGTLSDFAALHHDPQTLLPLRGGHDGDHAFNRWAPGDGSTFTFTVGLAASAGNSYMGCDSRADLDWLAE